MKQIEHIILHWLQLKPEKWWTPNELAMVCGKFWGISDNPNPTQLYKPLSKFLKDNVVERKMINGRLMSYRYLQPPINNDYVADGCERFDLKPTKKPTKGD